MQSPSISSMGSTWLYIDYLFEYRISKRTIVGELNKKNYTIIYEVRKTVFTIYMIVRITRRPSPSNILKSVVSCTSAFPFSNLEM